MNESKKPYIILSAAMTIDGKIASRTGDPELSDEQDWQEVHKLRTEVDAIMVGKGTILKDDPKLHIKYHEHSGYYRIVVDSNLSIPIDAKVVTYQQELYPTFICTTENITKYKERNFEEKGIIIIKVGKGKRVLLSELLPKLYEFGIKSILLEGGGTLNWSFIKNDLIDEIRLTIAPWMVGGQEAVSLVEGLGFEKMKDCPQFKLESVRHRDDYVMLNYKRRENANE
ncbi:MAG: 2,5-diamino-6-(ribosylamino)-4(3H)-pyrimidinone 5'-phosphate reductase [Promethearchaeia archaeon]